MLIDEFIGALQTASQIFVWVEFSEHRACFIKTSKSAIREFMKQQSILDDDFFSMPPITEDDIYAFKRDDELFIGAPPKDEEI